MGPLKFEPILKTIVWGGEKIAPYKGIETEQNHIGESWELSGVAGNESVVSEGPLKGKTIAELTKEYKGKLVGEHVYANTGDEFPLLIKFIDALSDLSIQVHPNDELAAKRHNGSKGKTEMWYVVAADEGAHLLAGLTKKITPEEYAAKVADGTITDVLARYDVHPGDVFFLPAGRIHAICGGCFIAEIQQTSNITYRIYDYGRLGLDGKPREVHTELAKDAIDYTVYPDYRTPYTPAKDEEVEVVSCPYFTTSILDLTLPYAKDLSDIDSFMVVMCLEGEGSLEVDGQEISVHQGETVLIPADADDICFVPDDKMKVLTSFIK
ncbi:MAG: class I mannose-6-phosphate isomerase [Bacteroidales bacterium]|nr:class I mannose-6-phosphate isomerase [Bacteroidales bacterium]